MAAHNQVRVLGYLLSDPAIYEDETGDAKIYLAIRACNEPLTVIQIHLFKIY